MYPFLYARLAEGTDKIEKYIVLIASHCDYAFVNTKWMNDLDLPGDRTMRLDVDLEQEKHEFDTEKEAMEFIRIWWLNETVSPDRFVTGLRVVDGKLSLVTTIK